MMKAEAAEAAAAVAATAAAVAAAAAGAAAVVAVFAAALMKPNQLHKACTLLSAFVQVVQAHTTHRTSRSSNVSSRLDAACKPRRGALEAGLDLPTLLLTRSEAPALFVDDGSGCE